MFDLWLDNLLLVCCFCLAVVVFTWHRGTWNCNASSMSLMSGYMVNFATLCKCTSLTCSSMAESQANAGEKFTSNNHSFKLLSMIMSKPYNSKHDCVFLGIRFTYGAKVKMTTCSILGRCYINNGDNIPFPQCIHIDIIFDVIQKVRKGPFGAFTNAFLGAIIRWAILVNGCICQVRVFV